VESHVVYHKYHTDRLEIEPVASALRGQLIGT
jgi:hypothetical protein